MSSQTFMHNSFLFSHFANDLSDEAIFSPKYYKIHISLNINYLNIFKLKKKKNQNEIYCQVQYVCLGDKRRFQCTGTATR